MSIFLGHRVIWDLMALSQPLLGMFGPWCKFQTYIHSSPREKMHILILGLSNEELWMSSNQAQHSVSWYHSIDINKIVLCSMALCTTHFWLLFQLPLFTWLVFSWIYKGLYPLVWWLSFWGDDLHLKVYVHLADLVLQIHQGWENGRLSKT